MAFTLGALHLTMATGSQVGQVMLHADFGGNANLFGLAPNSSARPAAAIEQSDPDFALTADFAPEIDAFILYSAPASACRQ